MIDRPTLLGLLRSSALARRFDFARAAFPRCGGLAGDAEVNTAGAAEIEPGTKDWP
jgi:hypothetical protein